MRNMSGVLRWAVTFVLFFVGFSLFLEVGERYRWIDAACIGLAIANMLVGSLVKLWRAVVHSDFSVTSTVFWLPRRWRAWIFSGPQRSSRGK
jgi:hypothetical protein